MAEHNEKRDKLLSSLQEGVNKEGLTKQVLSCKGLAQQLLFYGKRNGFI